MPAKPTIALIGPGNLGYVLARALHGAGYRIDEVVARDRPASLRRARQLARVVKAQARSVDDARLGSHLVWLCVSDDAIAGCARELATRDSWRGKIVLHSSGALSSGLLAPLRRRGAAVGSLHPMQSFVRSSRPEDMRGIWFGVEGDPAAVRVARRIARDLGGQALEIRARNKALYHALGSFASPMIVAVLALAQKIAGEAGVPQGARRGLIEPILLRTVENYVRRGASAAFSGPLVRGDITTIRAHLASLRRVPGALDVYKALVRSAIRTLPVAKRSEFEKLVGKAPGT
jgi:predicted short-subunit dehydrogenase-like oxidoreductase (DUF2520 family)